MGPEIKLGLAKMKIVESPLNKRLSDKSRSNEFGTKLGKFR